MNVQQQVPLQPTSPPCWLTIPAGGDTAFIGGPVVSKAGLASMLLERTQGT